MSTKLICPDCGGVLGEAEEGEAPCICFKDDFKAAAQAPKSELELTHTETDPTLSDTHPVDGITKVCFRCGCDVRGRKRYKDSRGYLCAECSDQEIAAEREGTRKCQSCGRRVKFAALTNFSGKMICKLCVNDIKETEKSKFKMVSSKHFDEESKRTLYIMLAVLAFLGILILISIVRIMRHGI